MPALQRRNRTLRLAYTAGFLVLSAGFWLVGIPSLGVSFLVLALVALVFFPAYYDWRVANQVNRAYQDSKMRATLSSRKLIANDGGLYEQSAMGEVHINWEAVEEIASTDTHTFITVQRVPSIVIPKSAMEADAYQAFVDACRFYWDQSRMSPTGGDSQVVDRP